MRISETWLFQQAANAGHSLALCSDGTVAAWGDNYYGQLGDNQASGVRSLVPVAVNTAPTSALSGKRVVALAAGFRYSMALCSDGTVAAWGWNTLGELGDNTTDTHLVPVAVNTASGVSALYGKTVVSIAAAEAHSLAFCSDGSIAAWGFNANGQLGDNQVSGLPSHVPVTVNTDSGISALYGRTVVAIAAGGRHNLALCSDGSVVAWGNNSSGQLGDNTVTQRNVPVVVNTDSGVSALSGKTVVAIAAGTMHSLALCSDGAVAAWGYNAEAELGDNTTTFRRAPVAVNTNSGVSALYGKTVVAIAGYGAHNLALCSDSTLAAWGDNSAGQIGDNTTTRRKTPVVVNSTPLAAGQRFTRVFSGQETYHTLALVAAPPACEIALTGAQALTNAAYRFAFTNTPGAFFGVLAATNMALPLSAWTSLTGLTEVSPGQFQFTDSQATNSPQRYYRVRSP
jgi:alpha-tubulin suppressor-like RCC1 family protein